ncbi:DNA internalization-related competence protein ComEC/Rec2 [Heyndrickxia sporothermodurans]|uniref:DNA internalization-related competence protein ComEC/Rec2 n=1 Tax=Heyndrickxia sporothermodurans TaxID=46224 RepID=UPI0015E67FFD|nr:DNA internalization-related competence protein ComEC/Rec2 [Heyndrickxia sporothermodurans]MED3649198.1 DNA internalization-related competence protein ComEC/Rec2 [Heyndrickxia sporothermodurans]MED3696679.1 DNA internalization-related competence protein ComEC/Rec2 [Heyndrickxia sporothermodurans]
MRGYWVFLAIVALSGCSISLDIHWGLVILFHLIWIRIIFFKKRYLIYSSIIVYVLFILISFWMYEHRSTVLNPSQTTFTVFFNETPQIDGNQLKSIVKTKQNEKIVLKYKIQTKEEKERLKNTIKNGQYCTITGELIQPEPNRNENLFNYKQYLFRNNIHWILNGSTLIGCKDTNKNIITKIKQLREQGMKNIDHSFSKETAPYAKALIFGDSSSFNDEIYSLYQRLGIVHLLAISGLHVSIITAAIFYLLIRIGFSREFASYALLALLPIYTLLTGANPPVVRAASMSMLVIISMQKKSPFSSLDALSISFILFLVKDPFILFNIGFQLSFTVCFSIILASKSILPMYKHYLTKSMMVSFVSQVAAIPILAVHFFEFSIISVISNVMYVPFYTFIVLPLLIITYISAFIYFPIFTIFEKVSGWMIFLSEKIGQLIDVKGSVLIIGKPGIIVLLLLIVTSQWMFFMLEKGYSVVKSLVPLVFVITLIKTCQIYSPIGEVTFIDVGQGDSILIRLPFHRGTYLIDTGGQMDFQQDEWKNRTKKFEIGNDIIIPLLKSKGITTIDKMVLTHSDADHIGAAKEIIENLSVKQIFLSPDSWEKPLMNNTLDAAKKHHIPIKVVKAGAKWSNASGVFQFVSPFDDSYEGNNDSLVLYAQVGGKRWLFTGDLEEQGEMELLNNYKFEIDVLKVGHHGSISSTSEAFINALKPKFAIISAGKNNRYGHPRPEVLALLANHHIQIFRTDQQGAIQYKFYQNKGTFHTVLP